MVKRIVPWLQRAESMQHAHAMGVIGLAGVHDIDLTGDGVNAASGIDSPDFFAKRPGRWIEID